MLTVVFAYYIYFAIFFIILEEAGVNLYKLKEKTNSVNLLIMTLLSFPRYEYIYSAIISLFDEFIVRVTEAEISVRMINLNYPEENFLALNPFFPLFDNNMLTESHHIVLPLIVILYQISFLIIEHE